MKCDKCGKDKPSALLRNFLTEILSSHGFVRDDKTYDPALCQSCCSNMPGRGWMRTSLPASEDAHVA